MIGKTVWTDGRNYVCDACNKKAAKFKSHRAAKAAGWAVSRDYTKCYCPSCAPKYRHTGRGGAKQVGVR